MTARLPCPNLDTRHVAPLGLTHGGTPLRLTATAVMEQTKLVVLVYGIWRWNKDLGLRQRYCDGIFSEQPHERTVACPP